MLVAVKQRNDAKKNLSLKDQMSLSVVQIKPKLSSLSRSLKRVIPLLYHRRKPGSTVDGLKRGFTATGLQIKKL